MRIPFRRSYRLTIAHRAGVPRPVTPWPLPWSVIGRRFRLRHVKLTGLPTLGGTAPEPATERHRFQDRGTC